MKAHKVELNIKQKQQPSGVAESTAVWKKLLAQFAHCLPCISMIN